MSEYIPIRGRLAADNSVSGLSQYQSGEAIPIRHGGTGAVSAAAALAALGAVTLANDGNNRLITADGSGGLNGEVNLTFDGTTLAVTGAATVSTTLGVTGATALAAKVVIGKTGTDTQDLVIEQSADNTLGGLRIYETGGVDWAALYSSGGVAYLQNQDTYMSLGPNGVAINDGSGNANMTVGLTINQGANDNEILNFKSSDIAHGMTDHLETDSYGKLSKSNATAGGLLMTGYTEGAAGGLVLYGTTTTDTTTKSTAGLGVVNIYGNKKNGTSNAAVGTDGNVVCIVNNTNTRFIFDAEGSSHADVEWVTYDTYNDLETISEMETVLLANELPEQTPRRHAMEATGIIGKDSWHMENGKPRAMVNFSKLAMLHHGALIQVGDRFRAMEEAHAQEIAELKGQLNLLMERN
jgi:hypothetical protein